MARVVKITRRTAKGHTTYTVSIPKAIIEMLNYPREAIVRLEISNGKPLIIIEPVLRSKSDP